MVKEAVNHKLAGKKTYKDAFKAGVFVRPDLIPHKNQAWTIDKRTAVIGTSRIWRCRPQFDDWELDFTIEIRDERIQPALVKEVLTLAGLYVGIGDYRPRFGLFEVTRFDVQGETTKRRRAAEAAD